MSGPSQSEQAMQRIFNKEGVTKVDHQTHVKTPAEKANHGLVSKVCDSGPGHPEATAPFYQGKKNDNS